METLRKVGSSAVKMSFIPDIIEGLTVSVCSPLSFRFTNY